jgi:hypothetical protein
MRSSKLCSFCTTAKKRGIRGPQKFKRDLGNGQYPIVQEYNMKIVVPQTMAMSSSRDNPTTIATAKALPKTKAI